MRVRIHRGADEIGGNCIEVAAEDGSRIVLDVGRPLSADWNDDVAVPPVAGFATPDPSLLAIVVSHPHLDHYGLVAAVPSEVPIYMGREAASLLGAASFFSPVSAALRPAGFLEDGVPISLGPFTLTPRLNDHSAFDAYSLLIDADGKRVFYTGDIRAHGRKAALFERLVTGPPADVDVLMMEGTHVRPDDNHDAVTFDTEAELEDQFVELCRETRGAVAVFGSAQNLDRLVSVYRAARRSSREFVIDLYGATVAAATRSTIPQPGFSGLRVFVPQRQRVRVKQAQEFWRTAEIKPIRVFGEELAAQPHRFLFYVPSSTARELVNTGVLTKDGAAVWSLWEGYLHAPSGQRLVSMLTAHGVPFSSIHTSGHASVPDLQRLVTAMEPQRVVPIHSEATNRFAELFASVERHTDGEWWEV